MWKRYNRFVQNLSIELKVGFLILFSQLDPALNRCYRRLAKRLETKEPLNHADNQSRNQLNLPKFQRTLKYYRMFSTAVHCINFIKYSIVFLAIDARVLPKRINCVLLGRMSVNYFIHELSRIAALYIILVVLTWRFVTLATGYNFELDLMMFLTQDLKSVREESRKIVSAQSRYTSKGETGCQNLLQKVIAYPVNYGDFVVHRLRPNRTELARKRIIETVNYIWMIPFVALISCSLIVIPSVLDATLFDRSYTQLYPTCCPTTETMLRTESRPSRWKISFNSCSLRLYSLPFDLFDVAIMSFDFLITSIPPIAVMVLLTKDLLIHWEEISFRIKKLAERLRRRSINHNNFAWSHQQDYETMGPWSRQANSSFLVDNKFYAGPDFLHGKDMVELMGALCDFFDSMGRVNQYARLLLSFLVFVFLLAIVTNSLALYIIPELKVSLTIHIFFFGLYFSFLTCSAAVLRLRSELDRSYLDLCTIMALDKAERKRKWMFILDNYKHRPRNTYSLITGTRFTWAFVLNCTATTLSFLAAVQTYRSYRDNK